MGSNLSQSKQTGFIDESGEYNQECWHEWVLYHKSKSLPASLDRGSSTLNEFERLSSKSEPPTIKRKKAPTFTIGPATNNSPESDSDKKLEPHILNGIYCIQKPDVIDITSAGAMYPTVKDQKTAFGVNFEVPKGAVPTDAATSLEVAVCLSIGSSQYPEDTTPISPILQLHPKENFKLLQPITVTMPHILSEPSDIGVMKAVTTEDRFEKIDTEITLGNKDGHGTATFRLEHFCYIQLYTKLTPDTTKTIRYCIFPVLPRKVPFDGSFMLYFCISYHMKECREAIEDQCKNIAKLKEHGHELVEDKLQPFSFKPEANSISATCTRPKQKSGWEWRNLNGERGIVTESVKPWSMDPANLKDEANRFLYPPSFKVEVRGSGNRTSQDEIVMNFSGNTETPLPDIGFYLPGNNAALNLGDHDKSYLSLGSTVYDSATCTTQESVLRTNYEDIISMVSQDTQGVADSLFSKRLIETPIRDDVRDDRRGSNRDRARKIVDNIFDRIKGKHINYEHFRTFLDILASQSQENSQKIKEILDSDRENLSPTIETDDLASSLDSVFEFEAPPSTSDIPGSSGSSDSEETHRRITQGQ